MFYRFKGFNVESYQGKALVASPYLTDSNFMRCVVYILQHDGDGAFGLVLNRPLNLTVGQLFEDWLETKVKNDKPVFYGGPVEGLVVMMQASLGMVNEQKIMMLPKVREQFAEIANEQNSDKWSMRIFDGYSGWGPSQLENELQEGSWLIWDPPPNELMADPAELWQSAVRQIGRDVLSQSVVGVLFGNDPTNN